MSVYNEMMKRFFIFLVLPLLLVSIWALVSIYLPAFLLPSPKAVALSFVQLWQEGAVQKHIYASGCRVFFGFCIAAFMAMPLAYLNYSSENSERATRLLLEALRFIPPLSLIPLLILWLGIGEASKVTIVVLACFFPIYINTLEGFKQIGKPYKELAHILKLTRSERFVHLELPGATPSILAGLRIGFGYSWRALVGAELIAASSGLGYLIGDASEISRTDQVFVGIICIAVLGIVIDQLFQIQIARMLPWKKGGKN